MRLAPVVRDYIAANGSWRLGSLPSPSNWLSGRGRAIGSSAHSDDVRSPKHHQIGSSLIHSSLPTSLRAISAGTVPRLTSYLGLCGTTLPGGVRFVDALNTLRTSPILLWGVATTCLGRLHTPVVHDVVCYAEHLVPTLNSPSKLTLTHMAPCGGASFGAPNLPVQLPGTYLTTECPSKYLRWALLAIDR